MNIDTTAEGLARMAAQGLRLDPPPTEEEIRQVLDRLALAFGVGEEAVSEAVKLLHARYRVRMEMGQTIKEEHVPWLNARRSKIDPFYWNRYHEFLMRGGWSPNVASVLGQSMDELLDMLGNPADPEKWKRRGLVVGDVQSGKTASYAALICKAADAGYKMVILLTGTLENVRRQTQERLDAAFVGFDSRDFLAQAKLKHKTHIGVGLIDGRRDGVVFTSRDSDFKRTDATKLNISLESVREPVLVVTKKNKAVLSSLAAWLRSRNADRDGHIDLPLLLIDDEADNASINTRLKPEETTAINAAIRDLLRLFRRSSYVGFTATPFANIFIDPSSATEMLGDDLFPSGFVHLLAAPNNYVSMNHLFPVIDPELPEKADQQAWAAGIRTIADSGPWLPLDHKQDVIPGVLPESLRRALGLFLLSCAIRDLKAASPNREERGIHRSMLVNVSRFTTIQNQVATSIRTELERLKDQIRLYGKLPDDQVERSAEIAWLRDLFEEEYAEFGFDWTSVRHQLHESISPIVVQAVNQETGAASLDYSVADTPPGVRVIAVGGNSLSRGLTLEGLCISYLLRNSKTYDTLLQMGRWFGYRHGYEALCRLFLSEDAEGWYRHVTQATNELKRDFARMRRQKATPAEFGLRVRTHPDTLLITACNKMATGVDVVGTRDISLEGRGIETARLYADKTRNDENLRVVDQFLRVVSAEVGRPNPTRHGNTLIWRDVGASSIAQLLNDFLVHPLNHDFQGDSIASFLLEALAKKEGTFSRWTVALPAKGERGPVKLDCGLDVSAKKRRVLVRPLQSLLVSGKGARVGSQADVRHGLYAEQLVSLLTTNQTSDIAEDICRAHMTAPLILIYLLRGVEREGKGVEERAYKDGLVLPALGLHFPGIRQNTPKHYVKYRLNRVAQAELELDGDDLGDDVDED